MALSDIIIKLLTDNARGQQGNAQVIQQFQSFLSLDMVKWEEDFLGDTLIGSYQTQADAGATALAITAPTSSVPFGTATMVTGATDDDASRASLGLHYRGEYNAVMAAIVSMSAITSIKVEVGWHDTTASAGEAVVNVLATPTYTGTDGACWIFDTDDTGNVAWQGVGVANGTGITKVEPTSIGNADGDAAPNTNVRELLIVALREGSARFLRGDNIANDDRWAITYDSGWNASAVTATVSLTPWLMVQARSAASRTLTIDYLGAWCWRSS